MDRTLSRLARPILLLMFATFAACALVARCVDPDPVNWLAVASTITLSCGLGIVLKLSSGERSVDGIKALRELGGELYGRMKDLGNAFNERKKKRDAGEDVELWPDDGETHWTNCNADYDLVRDAIEQEDRAAGVAAQLAAAGEFANRSTRDDGQQPGNENTPDQRGQQNGPSTREVAIQAWFRSQAGVELSDEEVDACRESGIRPGARNLDMDLFDQRGFDRQRRDLTTTTGSSGAYTIPEGFVPNLEQSMLYFGPMLQAAEVITTNSGNDLPWPTANDSGNTGALIGENTQVSETDPTFGVMVLQAYKFTSSLVQVPVELLEDSAFDLASRLGQMLGERIGRVLNTYCTTGTGSSQPKGIVAATAAGKTTASATAIDETELIDLMHSVDRAYRDGPQAGFMMHDLILAAVRKLQDSNGNFYFTAGMVAGEPDTILGKRIWVNNDMDSAVTAANKVMLFGDFSKYKIRRVRSVRFRRLVERYADYDQEGFVAFLRADGDLLDAGTDPIKHMITAAS